MQVTNPQVISSSELKNLAKAAAGSIDKLYLHWTAGHYHQFFDDYHLNIDSDGKVYRTCESLTEKKAHTWKRNTGSVGITLCCCADATWNGTYPDYGSEPPTIEQLRSLVWVIAILCSTLDIPLDGYHVMTHGEAAYRDGYGPYSGDPETRWDLFWLEDEQGEYRQGGAYIRILVENLLESKEKYAWLLNAM